MLLPASCNAGSKDSIHGVEVPAMMRDATASATLYLALWPRTAGCGWPGRSIFIPDASGMTGMERTDWLAPGPWKMANPVGECHWGSTGALAALQGREPSGRPEAEL